MYKRDGIWYGDREYDVLCNLSPSVPTPYVLYRLEPTPPV